jgi:tetratricopeptide (TPR) repeat protein
MCQWFHVYGMSEESVRTLLATFQEVFPHTVVFKDRDLIVLGAREPIRFSLARLVERFKIPAVKASLGRAFVAYPTDLLVRLRLDETGVTEFARSVPINTDDNMLIELDAPQTLYADQVDAIRAALDRYPPDALALMTDYGTEAAAHFELAASYFTAGQDERALRHCERALAWGASFDRLKLLGQIEQRRGHPDRARAAWQSALAAGGDPAGRAFVSALLASLDAPAGA